MPGNSWSGQSVVWRGIKSQLCQCWQYPSSWTSWSCCGIGFGQCMGYRSRANHEAGKSIVATGGGGYDLGRGYRVRWGIQMGLEFRGRRMDFELNYLGLAWCSRYPFTCVRTHSQIVVPLQVENIIQVYSRELVCVGRWFCQAVPCRMIASWMITDRTDQQVRITHQHCLQESWLKWSSRIAPNRTSDEQYCRAWCLESTETTYAWVDLSTWFMDEAARNGPIQSQWKCSICWKADMCCIPITSTKSLD